MMRGKTFPGKDEHPAHVYCSVVDKAQIGRRWKVSGKMNLFDVLHELIAQETTQLRETPMVGGDGRKADKRKIDMIRMRKISKRDAYYRVIHILRGYDTEFSKEDIDV